MNTKNYLVLNSYVYDNIITEQFREIIKVVFENNNHKTFDLIVGIYKDSEVFPQENILSREEIISEIKMQNYTSTYIETITLWSE